MFNESNRNWRRLSLHDSRLVDSLAPERLPESPGTHPRRIRCRDSHPDDSWQERRGEMDADWSCGSAARRVFAADVFLEVPGTRGQALTRDHYPLTTAEGSRPSALVSRASPLCTEAPR